MLTRYGTSESARTASDAVRSGLPVARAHTERQDTHQFHWHALGEDRTGHFSQLRTPALFVHGTRDPFGSIEEMREALRSIPVLHKVVECDKLGHELSPAIAPAILREAECFGNA